MAIYGYSQFFAVFGYIYYSILGYLKLFLVILCYFWLF